MQVEKIIRLFRSGKSLPVKESVEILKSLGYNVSYDTFKGYRDTKKAGDRFVTSRKEVMFYKIIVSNNDGKEIITFNSEHTSHTSYSLTSFVINCFALALSNNQNICKKMNQ